jgi:hypothetical protein
MSRSFSRNRVIVVLILFTVAAVATACGGGGSGVSYEGVPLVISPSSTTYHSGQTIAISMAANKLFTKYLRLNILQCSDPGGTSANLPTSVNECDGNTIQGPTILVAKDGSFSINNYEIFELPSAQLGEKNTPVKCDKTNECVLYIGENQEDFRQPKIFSPPFTVSPSGSSS